MEEEWGMEVVDEFENSENRRKLDEQRKRLQKELRDIEKLSFIPQESKAVLNKGCNSSCRTLSKKGMNSCRSISAEEVPANTQYP